MPPHSQPWPVAPRPFDDEAFGSWLGRLASRYRIGVDDLVRAAGIELDNAGLLLSMSDHEPAGRHGAVLEGGLVVR